jgi:hypothetical protein
VSETCHRFVPFSKSQYLQDECPPNTFCRPGHAPATIIQRATCVPVRPDEGEFTTDPKKGTNDRQCVNFEPPSQIHVRAWWRFWCIDIKALFKHRKLIHKVKYYPKPIFHIQNVHTLSVERGIVNPKPIKVTQLCLGLLVSSPRLALQKKGGRIQCGNEGTGRKYNYIEGKNQVL